MTISCVLSSLSKSVNWEVVMETLNTGFIYLQLASSLAYLMLTCGHTNGVATVTAMEDIHEAIYRHWFSPRQIVLPCQITTFPAETNVEPPNTVPSLKEINQPFDGLPPNGDSGGDSHIFKYGFIYSTNDASARTTQTVWPPKMAIYIILPLLWGTHLIAQEVWEEDTTKGFSGHIGHHSI